MAYPKAFFRLLYAPVAVASLAMSLAACQNEPSLEEHRAARLEEQIGHPDDAVISTRVTGAIYRNVSLQDADIHVQTVNNVVRLSGHVMSQGDAVRAERAALTVKDVSGVKDDLIVR